MRSPSSMAVLLLGACSTTASMQPSPGPVPPVTGPDDGVEVRGVTISCPTWGWEWGTDDMADTLTELNEVGVNWVAIHPYARIRNNGEVRFDPIDPAAPPAWLVRPIREAHARGQRVLIKPHIAYWGSKFSWRGDIRFDDPEDQARFFQTYQAWVANLAAASTGADAFAVGTELDGTVMHETQWRAVIADIRAVFHGPLTYASNWDGYDTVPFWDALDAVGVQAYFPISDAREPTDAQLDAGWARVMKGLRAANARTGKPVVFTELGYPRSPDAAKEPWAAVDHHDGGLLQERCLRAALRAIKAEPAVVGAFLWKEMPGSSVAEDFALERPEVRAVMKEAWAR